MGVVLGAILVILASIAIKTIINYTRRGEKKVGYLGSRPLGIAEQSVNIWNEAIGASNICLSMQLDRRMDPVILREVINTLQAKYAFLHTVIIHDPTDNGELTMKVIKDYSRLPEIPLIVKEQSCADWKFYMEQDINAPFPMHMFPSHLDGFHIETRYPLARLVLLNDEQTNTSNVVFTLDHRLADGSCIAILSENMVSEYYKLHMQRKAVSEVPEALLRPNPTQEEPTITEPAPLDPPIEMFGPWWLKFIPLAFIKAIATLVCALTFAVRLRGLTRWPIHLSEGNSKKNAHVRTKAVKENKESIPYRTFFETLDIDEEMTRKLVAKCKAQKAPLTSALYAAMTLASVQHERHTYPADSNFLAMGYTMLDLRKICRGFLDPSYNRLGMHISSIFTFAETSGVCKPDEFWRIAREYETSKLAGLYVAEPWRNLLNQWVLCHVCMFFANLWVSPPDPKSWIDKLIRQVMPVLFHGGPSFTISNMGVVDIPWLSEKREANKIDNDMPLLTYVHGLSTLPAPWPFVLLLAGTVSNKLYMNFAFSENGLEREIANDFIKTFRSILEMSVEA